MQKIFGIVLIATLSLLSFSAAAQTTKGKTTDSSKTKSGGVMQPLDAPPDDGGGGLTASVDIIASSNTVCSGSTVNFDAYHYFNGGDNPGFVWYVNGQNTSMTGHLFSINNITASCTVYCIITSSDPLVANPAQSNVVSITVNSLISPAVSVTPVSASACSGTPMTFTAQPTNQGAAPFYQWMLDGVGVSGATGNTFTTNTLNNGQSVSVRLISNAECLATSSATSAAVPVTILSVPGVPAAPSGSTSICEGGTAGYTTSASGATGYNWSATGGTATGSGNSATVTWTPGVSGTAYVTVTASNGCGTSVPATTVVNITPTVAPAAQPTGITTTCQGSSGVVYSTAAVSGSTGYQWSITPSGAGSLNASGNICTVNWSSSYFGGASIGVATSGCNASGTPTTLQITINPPAGFPVFPVGPRVISNGSGATTYTTSALGASGYTWSLFPSNAGAISGVGGSANVIWDPSYVGAATVAVQAIGCNGLSPIARTGVQVYASLKGGDIVPAYQAIATGGTPVKLICPPAQGGNCGNGNITYDWQKSTDGVTFSSTGISTLDYNPTPTVTTYYQRIATCGSDVASSNVATVEIKGNLSDQDLNYVRTRIIQKPGVMDAATANGLTIPEDVQQSTIYFDGLGRPVQTVVRQASPKGFDIVTLNAYDPFGREGTHYLPFVSITGDGNYKPSALQEHQSFNAGQFPDEHFFYGQTVFEPSPLNRPLKETAPGNSWQGNNIGVGSSFELNSVDDSVRLWKIDYASGSIPVNTGTYQSGRLYRTVTTDEKGHRVVEFKDLAGQVILKKVQQEDYPGTAHVGWLCTYYVYDDVDNLRFVLQPRAVEVINKTAGNWIIPQQVADGLCFRYEYDSRNRMIVKHVPDASEMSMVYDSRDRLVFTQDANQKALGQWISNQYDALNRLVVVGQMTYGASRSDLQNTVSGNATTGVLSSLLPANLYLSTPDEQGDNIATDLIDMQDGFSTPVNGSFSASIVPQGTATSGYPTGALPLYLNPIPTGATVLPLIINYYDNYDWVASTGSGLGTNLATDKTESFNYFNTAYNAYPDYAVPVAAASSNLGQVTGTMHLVLNENRPLYTVNFYDDRYRPTQSRSMNYTGGVDTITNQYDFIGKTLRSLTTHYKSGPGSQYHTVLTKMDYDAGSRLLHVWKNIDGAPADQPISALKYNELGQLTNKELGNNLDNLNYTYNIRGWITSINKDYIASTTTAPLHYFGLELGYDKGLATAGGTSFKGLQLNGNIAGAIWKSAGDGVGRQYDFTYDNVSRLTGADFTQSNGSTFDKSAGLDFSVSNLAYDANGNIRKMQQKGWKLGGSITLDNLTYTYSDGSEEISNKLRAVTEDPSIGTMDNKMGDFTDKNQSLDDYSYDDNGNLITDKNKGISSTVYNYLNLPSQISVDGKGTISYTYDAAGSKLKKTTVDHTGATTRTTNTTYIGGFVYQNDSLQFTGHEEGRARWAFHQYVDGSSNYGWEYDFFEKDHLGNTRVVLTQEKDTAQYIATMETAYREKEKALFSNVDESSYPSASVPGGYPADNTTTPNQFVAKVNGNPGGQKLGPALLLKVMTGDAFDIGTKALYRSGGTAATNNGSIPDLLNSMAQGLITLAAPGHGTIGDLNNTSGSPVYAALNSFMQEKEPALTDKPRAYLNWILLDNQFKYVQDGSGAAPVYSPDELNILGRHVDIHHSGYLYIWVSNETKDWDVFFDNLSVTHYAGPMLEENHYYPFGLQMSGLCDRALKSNYAENKYRYNGSSELQSKEFSDGAGLETYDATFRMYDPQIGRFWQIDPLAEVGEAWSPYSFVLNNPLSFNDPMGLKDSLDPVTVTPFNNTPPCCKIAFIPGTGSPTPVDIPPPPDEVLDIPVNQPTGEPSGEPVSEPLPPGAPVVSPLALGLTAVFSAIPITGNTDWPGGNELFYKEHPEFLDRRQTPSAKNKSASDLYLVRFGDLPESREKLAADAAEAQAGGFPHGVSSFLRAKPPTNGRYAKLLDVMRRFEIKKTGRADHFTIVLPNPVTQQVAIDFNLLFIKR